VFPVDGSRPTIGQLGCQEPRDAFTELQIIETMVVYRESPPSGPSVPVVDTVKFVDGFANDSPARDVTY
jgi:hypothetical protein